VAGTIELGMAICEAMQMQAAAETGAFYAAKYGFDEAGITAAVINATNAAGVTATAAEFCGCPSAGGLTNEGAPPCSTTCTGGGVAGKYVLITARIAHFTVIPAPLPGLTIPATLSGRAIVRLQ
jgi:Flp pilus assembly protein TadG